MAATRTVGAAGARSWGQAHVPKGLSAGTSKGVVSASNATEAATGAAMVAAAAPTAPESLGWDVIAAGLRSVEGLEERVAGSPSPAQASASASSSCLGGVPRAVATLVDSGRGGWLYERLTDEVSAAARRAAAAAAAAAAGCSDGGGGVAVRGWEGFERYLSAVCALTAPLEEQWVRRRRCTTLLGVLPAGRRAAAAAFAPPAAVGAAAARQLLSALLSEERVEGGLDARAMKLLRTLPAEAYAACVEVPLAAGLRRRFELLRQDVARRTPPLVAVADECRRRVDAAVGTLLRAGAPHAAAAAVRRLAADTLLGGGGGSGGSGNALAAHVLGRAQLLGAAAAGAAGGEAVAYLVALTREAAASDALVEEWRAGVLQTLGEAAAATTTGKGAATMEAVWTFDAFATRAAAGLGGGRGGGGEAILRRRAALLDSEDGGFAAARAVARHVDTRMRRGGCDGDACWEEVAAVCGALVEGDRLDELLRRRLALRLLPPARPCLEEEGRLLARLRLARPCGGGGVRRMETMLRDVAASQEGGEAAAEVRASVLSSAAWPATVTAAAAAVPAGFPPGAEAVAAGLVRFEGRYAGRHSGRVLRWLPALAHVTLVARLGPAAQQRLCEVSCGTSEAWVLLRCFGGGGGADDDDDDDVVASRAAAEASLGDTAAAVAEAAGAVARLVAARLLLVVAEEGEEVPSRQLRLAATHKARKVVVRRGGAEGGAAGGAAAAAAAAQATREERAERKALVEAAIVRVAKSRRTLHVNQLLEATVAQLKGRFRPDVSYLKVCVGVLCVCVAV